MREPGNRDEINRLVSEDRLDKMIVLASPATWISIVGAFLVIGALFLWGFFGKLPTSVDARGIFMNSSGTVEVFSQKDGFVLSVSAKEGQEIYKDDLIVTLGTEEEMFQLRQLDNRIQYVEAMTFDSEYDIVSADTREMANIKLQSRAADRDYENQKAELELRKEKLARLANLINEKQNTMLGYKEAYYASLNITDDQAQLRYNEANADYSQLYTQYEQARNTYINARENYYSLRDDFDAKYASYDPADHSEEENSAYDEAAAKVENARVQSDDYEVLMNRAAEKLTGANNTLEKTRTEYLEYLNSISGIQADNIMASTEYSEALNDFNTARAQYQALSDEIDNLQETVLLAEGKSKDDAQNYEAQFNNLKSSILLDLQAQRDRIFNSASLGDVRSASDGKVYNISLYPGEAVARGAKVATLLASGTENDNTVIFYVRVDDIKKVRTGMEVYVYPSTVKKEEYGHMEGYVTYVSGHVASNDDMLKQLGSESLVTDFSAKGPVVEVRCALKRDSNTVSGYKWSSERGKDIALDSGTTVTAQIITEEKSPLDLFIPYLRERFDMEIEEAGQHE